MRHVVQKVGFFAVCIFVSVHAISQEGQTPEAAMREYVKAVQSYDTQIMAQWMHPEALQRIRTSFDSALRGSRGFVARVELLPMFSVSSVDAFAALSDVEVYKRVNDYVVRAAPDLVDMMRNSEYEIVGSILREDVAYLVYILTMSVQGRSTSTYVVQLLKRHDGKWLLLLPSDGEATILQLETRYGTAQNIGP